MRLWGSRSLTFGRPDYASLAHWPYVVVAPNPLNEDDPPMSEQDSGPDQAIQAARERYRAERDKRVRGDGLAQYEELTGDFADFESLRPE